MNIKFKWDSMTSFARDILKKMGAVPTSDLNNAYQEIGRLTVELNNVAYKNAQTFPYLIEPETLISYDRVYDQQRFKMRSRNLQYVIDRHMIEGLSNPEYKRFLVRHLSNKWAEQTGEILEEIIKQREDNVRSN